MSIPRNVQEEALAALRLDRVRDKAGDENGENLTKTFWSQGSGVIAPFNCVQRAIAKAGDFESKAGRFVSGPWTAPKEWNFPLERG